MCVRVEDASTGQKSSSDSQEIMSQEEDDDGDEASPKHSCGSAVSSASAAASSHVSSCFKGCIKAPETRVCVHVFSGLLLVAAAGFVHFLLVICIFMRSEHMGGTSGAHGIVVLSILVILTAMLLIYVSILYCLHRKRQTKASQASNATDWDDEEEESSNNNEGNNNTAPEEELVEESSNNHEGNNNTAPEEESEESLNNDNDNNTRPVPASAPDSNNKQAFSPITRLHIRHLFLRIFLPLSIVLLIGTEVGFLLVMPRNSILPLVPPFGQDALLAGGVYRGGCSVQWAWDDAKEFFRNNTRLNLDDVQLVYGGTSFDYPLGAKVLDNTIYFPKYTCPSAGLLVHELVHIVQEQTGYWRGVGGARRAFQYFADSLECSDCLYDYGGYDTLQSTMELALSGDSHAADVFEAFGPEQMAEIVEAYFYEYFWCQTSYEEEEATAAAPNTTANSVPTVNPYWYCKPLEFYASQILTG